MLAHQGVKPHKLGVVAHYGILVFSMVSCRFKSKTDNIPQDTTGYHRWPNNVQQLSDLVPWSQLSYCSIDLFRKPPWDWTWSSQQPWRFFLMWLCRKTGQFYHISIEFRIFYIMCFISFYLHIRHQWYFCKIPLWTMAMFEAIHTPGQAEESDLLHAPRFGRDAGHRATGE